MKLLAAKILFFILLILPSASFAEDNLCIPVIVSGSPSRTFWAEVIDGATTAGKELNIRIYARGTVNDMDDEAQHRILQGIMKKYQCQALVIAPSDVSRNKDISALLADGIPSIYIDRDTGGDRVAVVQTDNFAAGQLAARKLVKALENRGNRIVLFKVQEGVVSTDLREAGFKEEAQKLGLNLIAEEYLGTRVGDARWKANDVLSQLENVDGIFTPNDTTTTGVILAREIQTQHINAVHIGFDESEFIAKSHASGKLDGYIIQQPFEIGYLGVYAAYRAITRNKPVQNENPPVIYID